MNYKNILMAILTSVSVTGSSFSHGEEPEAPATAQDRKAPRFKIAPDTTFVLSPVSDDGTIDYADAINKKMRADLKPEDNAVVWIMRALGRNIPNYECTPRIFQELGMQPPAELGDYLKPVFPNADVDVSGLDRNQQAELLEQYASSQEGPWKREQYPELATWIESNKVPLDLIHFAGLRNRYFMPIILEQDELDEQSFAIPLMADILPLCHVNRAIARMLCCRAMLSLGSGNHGAAWEDLMTCRQLGRLVSQGPSIIEVLVGIAIEQTANDATTVFLNHAQPSIAELQTYRAEMAQLPPIARISDKVNLMERCTILDAIQTMAIQEEQAVELLGVDPDLGAVAQVVQALPLQSIEWTGALRVTNGWYDRLVTAMDLPTYSDRCAAIAKIEMDLQTISQRIMSAENVAQIVQDAQNLGKDLTVVDGGAISRTLGEISVSLMLPKTSAARVAEDRIRQQMVLVDAALALAAYHASEGDYPEQLSELKPAYLKRIPGDLFTGKAVFYRRTDKGYLLYSAGPNRKDDAGRTMSVANPGDDLPIRVGRPSAN
jgi:hypothetical protein